MHQPLGAGIIAAGYIQKLSGRKTMQRYLTGSLLAILIGSLLSGCGGKETSDNTQSSASIKSVHAAYQPDHHYKKIKKSEFHRLVSFGDSLSDAGTYKVGTISAFGGGQFTVNSSNTRIWTTIIAEKLGLNPPCAAQTGLDGDPALGLSAMPPVNHPECTNYAQGGARVTNPVGIGNKLTGGANASLGFLTVPVMQQIQNHLDAHHDKFDEEDLVTVMAGANDIFFQLALMQAGATDPTTAFVSITNAADELAGAIKTNIIGKGAKHVVVLNIPDIAITPMSRGFDVQTLGLIDAMVQTFNYQLFLGLQNNTHVLYIDAYADSYSQYTNPGAYGLTNVTDTACDLTPEKNFLGSSLICSSSNLAANATNTFMFADMVHPTPYGHSLIAKLVSNSMRENGWIKHH
nr:Lip112 [uncultured bacterium]